MQVWIRVLLWSLPLCWISNFPCWAQQPNINSIPTQTDTAIPTITLKVGDTLRVKVLESLNNPKEKISIMLGNTDITSQVEINGNELIYRSNLVPLTVGKQDLTIYRTESDDHWTTLAVWQINVEPSLAQSPSTEPTLPTTETKPSSSSTETIAPSSTNFTITPKLSFNVKSQLFESRSPDAGVSQRPTFLNIDFASGLSAQYQVGKIRIDSKFTLVGTTFQPEALRFAEIQERAPQIDLSEYAINISDENNQFSVGHLCFGNHPFLLNNLCSRGVSGKIKLNQFSDISLARISSTSVVGFENILGLDRSENTLDSAGLGLQILQNQNGGVRLETTWVSGSRSPISNFNVGEIVDAEKSDGVGFRLTGSDDAGRVKVDAGFANSTFATVAANDPELNQGVNSVPLEPVNKNAWYAEASYDFLKDVKLDDVRNLSASINFRTERIDPQFGTLGATLQPDRIQTQYALNLSLAGATAQFQQNFSNDNIAEVANLLKTNNTNTNVSLSLPLQSLLRNENSLLPTVTYGFQQTQQIGSITAAANGGFADDQIPDQLSTTNQIGLAWKLGTVDFSYQYINAFQDNRQVGREGSDTRNITQQLATSWQATPQLRFTLGYNFINADDLEQRITKFTQSPTVGASWEFTPGATFAVNYNLNDDSDSLGQAFNRAESLELLLSWNFKINSLGQELPATTFIRYGKQSTLNLNSQNNINTNASIEAISAGLSLSF